MDAGEHTHRWVLVSAVLDGKGSFRVFACDAPDCDATAVQPASGDLGDSGRRRRT